MDDELERAGRKLLLVEDYLVDEEVRQEDMCMTQVPCVFSESERDEEDEEEKVLISTQVQGQLDEIAHEEDKMKSFRQVLGRFALETQEEMDIDVHERVGGRTRKRGTKGDGSRGRGRGTRNRGRSATTTGNSVHKRIKSITQFNADRWELDKEKDRAQQMLSLLSGKSAKVKELVSRLEQDNGSGSKAQRTQGESSAFAAFDACEWRLILSLLQQKLPKVSRTEIKNVQRYVYGDGNLWQASQSLPDSDSTDTGEGDTMLPTFEEYLDLMPVCTLSQIIDERCSQEIEHMDAEEIVDYEVNIEVPSSETEHVSQVADSCDSGSLISFEDATTEEHVTLKQVPILAPTSSISLKRSVDADQLIDLTQESYDAVSTIVSPIRKDIRLTSVQVPATRTTTLQDSSKQTGLKIHIEDSIFHGESLSNADSSIAMTNSLNLSAIYTHNKDEIVVDSEDEKDEYKIVEISLPKTTPVRSPVRTPVASMSYDQHLQNSPSPVLMTNPRASSTDPPASPSTKQLRQSLKHIGMKPCKNKVELLQAWDTLESKFSYDSDTDRATQLRQFLTDLIVKNRDISTDLMEKIYTFEPIRFYQLKDWLISLDEFTAMIDDSFLKNWADLNGIVFRNDTEEFPNSVSLSNSQSQSNFQSTLQTETELESQPYSQTN